MNDNLKGYQNGQHQQHKDMAQRVDELTRHLAAFKSVSQAANLSLEIDQILSNALNKTIEVLRADAGLIRLLDSDSQELVLRTHQGFSPQEISKSLIRRKFGEGKSWECARSGKPLVDEGASDYKHSFIKALGMSVSLIVPLQSRGRLMGIMSMFFNRQRNFRPEEIELFASMGNQIGVATENAKLHRNLNESGRKYKNLFENSGDALFVIDLEGKFNLVNRAVEAITGYSREELIGQHFKKIVAPQDYDFIQEVFDSGFESFSTISAEIKIVDKMGEEHIVELMKGASQVEESGVLIGFLITARDQTERKNIEEKLLQSAKLQSLGKMASGIAHDINNVLLVILGHTELLLHETRDEILKKRLKIIEQAALDGAETVRKIEDFTRLKPKEKELSPVDLHKIVNSALEFTSSRWKDTFQKKGFPFQLNLDLKEVPVLAGIESELREAFTNILLNSLDAMPQGGSLTIDTCFLEEFPGDQIEMKTNPEGFVKIEFTDTGIGMDEPTCKKVFDPFFSTKGIHGLGLGLSIAYGIIKRHNGEMKVASQKGLGSTFTVYLPVLKAAEKEEKTVVSPSVDKQTARIMVVDDDRENLDLISELMKRLGHQVITASNGEQGLKKFKTEGPFDIVFTDLGMPGISGWEFSNALKDLAPNIPVVLITGWGFQIEDDEIKSSNVDHVISKPFTIRTLTRVIDQILLNK